LAGPAEHLREADTNKYRADAFACVGDPWEIVLLFYSALHVMQGYIETKGARFAAENHAERWRAICAAPELRMARAAYKDLQDLSVQVRYDPDFRVAVQDLQNARDWYAKVRAIVEPKLKRAAGIP
jgi:hypothetical protein